MNSLVDEEGVIHGFDSHELDDVQPGILLYRMYRETGQERYKKALDTLIEVVLHFPKNREGGFWHKVKNKERCGWMGYIWQVLFVQNSGNNFTGKNVLKAVYFRLF